MKTYENVQIKYFSGYIRNWKSLCAELDIPLDMSRSEREEAILKSAYSEWKLDMMSHIFGMFAIAVFDTSSKKLYCIRDQVGQKQMFYTVKDGEFLCSGDINELAKALGSSKKR